MTSGHHVSHVSGKGCTSVNIFKVAWSLVGYIFCFLDIMFLWIFPCYCATVFGI